MPDLATLGSNLAWPLALAFAWIVGEVGHRATGAPRISLYGLVGFALASSQLGMLSAPEGGRIAMLANYAFGLILFELGYRINLRWFRDNPWLTVTGLLEGAGTFVAVYFVAQAFGTAALPSMLLAALAMSTSPAALLRVVNEERSSGQVTERALHLCAFNCVLAVFAFKIIVGFWVLHSVDGVPHAVWSSLAVLFASAMLGAAFGGAVPWALRRLGNVGRDTTIAFSLAVLVVIAIAHALALSPVLSALTFGLVARHRRVALSQAQQNFGALGDLLTVVLFVFVATTLEWPRVVAGASLGVALVGARLVVKTLVVGAFARLAGITWRKGVLSGLALTPISVFVILMLEQARPIGLGLVDQLAALAAATLLLELVGPILTQQALILAGESSRDEKPPHAA